MPIVESLHDVGAVADAEPDGPVGPVVVHAERPVAVAVAVAAAGLLDDAPEVAALEPFAQPHVADVLNEQGV